MYNLMPFERDFDVSTCFTSQFIKATFNQFSKKKNITVWELLFKRYDKNGDGNLLVRPELRDKLKEDAKANKIELNLTDKQMDDMIKAADKDNDGKLTLEGILLNFLVSISYK